MKKSSLLKIPCFIFFLFGITTNAQKVSNITFRQEQSNIIVSYDLETKTPCKVSLYVSTNGGVKWQGPLTKVTGDVGSKVVSGNHNITWNVLEEFEELKGDNIKFQVKAIGSDIETIKIGTQEWMAKNLNVSTYRNGDIIPEVKNLEDWGNMKIGAWCYYDNDPKKSEIYGKLYNWYAVIDPRGLALEGFHIPSNSEWNTLIDYLGGKQVAGGKMKEISTKHWKKPNTKATNSSGFNGLPGGYRYSDGTFHYIGMYGSWWSLSETSTTEAWLFNLNYDNGGSDFEYLSKKFCFQVRCIRD